MKIPSQIITLLFGIFLTLASLWYGYNHHLLPIAASQEAILIDDVFNVMMVIGTAFFILVQSAIIFVAYRYRRKPGDETDAKYVHGNIPLEIVWTAIPAVIVLALSLYSFDIYEQIGGLDPMGHGDHGAAQMVMTPENQHSSETHSDENHPMHHDGIVPVADTMETAPAMPLAADTTPFEVNVTGLQFAWLFNYVGTEVTAGELHLPIGRDALLNITAMDVLHAFWVPEFRIKQDAVPGRTIPIRIHPTREGTYPLVCAELCGAYHGVMRAQVVVQSQKDYDDWLATQVVALGENADPNLKNSIASSALYPELLSDEQYLAPYAQKIGIKVNDILAIQSQQQSPISELMEDSMMSHKST